MYFRSINPRLHLYLQLELNKEHFHSMYADLIAAWFYVISSVPSQLEGGICHFLKWEML